MKTYVLTCQKGGVAKTTTAYTLAKGLHNQGYKVLMVDTDPQSNLSFTAGIDVVNTGITLYSVLQKQAKISEAVNRLELGLDLVVGGLELSTADMTFTTTGREYMLAEALEEVQGKYDYCIIDTAPHIGIMTINALTAADYAIIPVSADIFALMGLSQLGDTIATVQKYSNRNLKVAGVLITRYSDRNAQKVMLPNVEQAAEQLRTRVFKTKIREATAIRESQILQSDIFSEAPGTPVAEDYNQFIAEVLQIS